MTRNMFITAVSATTTTLAAATTVAVSTTTANVTGMYFDIIFLYAITVNLPAP